MKCRICGRVLTESTTDLPFKISDRTIVIIKDLPVAQCEGCTEYLMVDEVFTRVEQLLSRVSASVEVEIIQFAA